ncbi:MAG: MATE family efflux transporter [Gammaproteobacteria bacterium]|nr:MATE family efflux transporter [Gammaproteobacteria bacterium]
MKHASKLTSGSIPRALATFALPILLGNVMQSINGSINAIWIGKFLGSAALTGANNANIVVFLLFGAVFGVTMAASIMIGRAVGAGETAEAKRVVGSSATFFFAASLLLAAVGFLLAPSILHWMGTPDDARAFGIDYLRVLFLALPASNAFFFVSAALRGAGDSRTPFRFLLVSTVLDIVLNPLFIFGWGPVPALGIAGSATATLVAQCVALGLLLRHVYRVRHPLALHADERQLLRVDWGIVRTLVGKGIPMGLQMIVLSTSAVLFLGIVNGFGSTTAAAFAADMQLWNYVQMPALALSAAVSSMAAQNIGAGHWDRVATIAKVGVAFNFLLTGSLVVLLYLAERRGVGVFLPAGSPAVDIAVHVNHIILWSFPLFGVSMVLSGVVRAAGAVMAPLAILALALLVVRAPLAWYSAGHWGAEGVWWSFSISAMVAALLSTAYYLHGSWRKARMGPTSTPAAGPAAA